jgi:ribokinase
VITLFGSICLDVSTRADTLPKPGETVIGDAYLLSPGGKGANQALAAHRAGARVRLLCAVGRDAFADAALATLRESGVDLSRVRRSTIAPTGLASIVVDQKGENQIVVAPGANSEMSADDLTAEDLDRWTLLVLQMELRPSETMAAISKARAADARVLFNFAPVRPLQESALDAVHILVLNASEGREIARRYALSASETRFLAGAIAERRGGAVVVTDGAAGAYVAESRLRVTHVPSPKVNVLDTTGAGDAFVGYLAAGIDLGMPLVEAARRAAVAGALACTAMGAQSAIPTGAEVDGFLAAIR